MSRVDDRRIAGLAADDAVRASITAAAPSKKSPFEPIVAALMVAAMLVIAVGAALAGLKATPDRTSASPPSTKECTDDRSSLAFDLRWRAR